MYSYFADILQNSKYVIVGKKKNNNPNQKRQSYHLWKMEVLS